MQMTLMPNSSNATVPDSSSRGRANMLNGGRPFSVVHRVLLILTGFLLISGLVVARCLTPDANGFGTHRQLGLPESGFARTFGVPCPSCGMTTAWAHLTRGHLILAAQCNLGGLLAGITALLAGPWMLVSGIRGRWLFAQPSIPLVLLLAITTYLALLGQWLERLWFS